MTNNTFNLEVQGTVLHGRYWQPSMAKAVVVLVHGMGEHMGRYEHSLIPVLVEAGFAVVAYDNFGHGKTKGKRGHCPNYNALLESVDKTILIANELFPKSPKFLYGHSMGGNLVINYLLRRESEMKGAIASSPFLRLAFQPPKWKLALGKVMLKLWPSITLPSALEVEAISRDPMEVKRYRDDVLVHDKVSPVYSFPVMEAGEWAIQNASQLNKPLLVLHGTGDRIIDHKASEEFANATSKADLKLFDNGYHELHHDLCREEFIQVIIDWLDRCI